MKPCAQFVTRLLLAIALLALRNVYADTDPRSEVRLVAFRVTTTATPSGPRESLQLLDVVRPGDTVEYHATYINNSAQTLHDVQLSVPIPAGGFEYVAAQRAPLANAASLDGKRFDALPLMRTVVDGNGRTSVKPVPLSEYRVLRWNLGELPAGATRNVRARMHMPALPIAAVADAAAH